MDRSKITSNFDAELLLSEDYITHILLAQIEAGILPTIIPIDNSDEVEYITLRPPIEPDYRTLYRPYEHPSLSVGQDGAFRVRLLEDDDLGGAAMAFDEQNGRLFVLRFDGELRAWQPDTGVKIDSDSFQTSQPISAGFSVSASKLAIYTIDGALEVWDVNSKLIEASLSGQTDIALDLAISPTETHVASASANGSVRIWELSSPSDPQTFTGHDATVTALAFSADSQILASGSASGEIRLWAVGSGATIGVLLGHSGSVNAISFSSDGTRLASGSEDGSVIEWDIQTLSVTHVLTDLEGPVTSVAFNQGSRLTAGDRNGNVRVWIGSLLFRVLSGHASEVNALTFMGPGQDLASFDRSGVVRLWPGLTPGSRDMLRSPFMSLDLWPIVRFSNGTELVSPIALPIELDLDILRETDDDDFESNHRLRLRVNRFGDETLSILQTQNVDPETLKNEINERLSAEIPLSFGGGRKLQAFVLKRYVTPARNYLGVYLNFALKSGPGPSDYFEQRGNLALAQDFGEPGDDLSFATASSLYERLSSDFKQRLAVARPGEPGEYSYPWHEDISDPNSKKLGKIKKVSVGPNKLAGTNVPTNEVLVTVKVENDGFLVDPDFELKIVLSPELNEDGLLEWKGDTDVKGGLATSLIGLAGGALLGLAFGPFGAFSGGLIGLALGLDPPDGLIEKLTDQKINAEDDALTLFEALPHNLTASTKRWDPFFESAYQIKVQINSGVAIDKDGIAFSGSGLFIDRASVPLNSVVLRDEDRDDEQIVSLRYQVPDFGDPEADYVNDGPGTLRSTFSRTDPDNEPNLVNLSMAELEARIEADQIRAPQVLVPKRVHIVDNQIDQILCITYAEQTAISNELLDAFRDMFRQDLQDENGEALEEQVRETLEQELGRAPTEGEVEARFEDDFEELYLSQVESVVSEYREGGFLAAREEAIASLIRLDMTPEEYAVFQEIEAFVIDGKELRYRINNEGDTVAYYRDAPDGDETDNLLNLPTYVPPFSPDQNE